MNAVFYGFQFPHHGQFSAFSAMSRELENQGVVVRQVVLPGWLSYQGLRRMHRPWVKANEYRLKSAFAHGSLVHYFFPENSLFQAPAWKKNGRLVLSCHQPVKTLMESREKGQLLPFFEGLKAADAVVLMASCELDAYRELAPQAEVLCIPHGVDTKFFSPADSLDKPDGTFRILTVGNWLRDYDLWAKVVERVSAECPSVEFSVLANPDILKAATDNLKSGQDTVRILQGISDEQLREEYRRADVVFLPLKDAWANNALLEGMACGRPVLVTDLPATREYAENAACFITKGDMDDAAGKLLHLYRHPAVRDQMGRQARVLMESTYAWEQIALKHVELYNRFFLESGI